MADEKKKAPPPQPNFAEKNPGISAIIFIVILFAIWVLTGGAESHSKGTKNNFFSSPETTKGTGY
jgi:hypothetical protein